MLSCLNDPGLDPWSVVDKRWYALSDRGLYMVLTAIVTGLLIDVVYTELFNLIAEWFVQVLHIRTKTEYESALINIMFPFHWGAFMFYFLLLAFFIPFGRQLNGFVYDMVGWGVNQEIFSAGANSTLAEADYLKFWMYEKRFLLEIDMALIGPLVVAVWLEFAFGQVLPNVEYQRIRWTIKMRGSRSSVCNKIALALSCCCRSPNVSCMSDEVVEDVITDHDVQEKGYARLQARVNIRLKQNGYTERSVHLVSGHWFTTRMASFKAGVAREKKAREWEAKAEAEASSAGPASRERIVNMARAAHVYEQALDHFQAAHLQACPELNEDGKTREDWQNVSAKISLCQKKLESLKATINDVDPDREEAPEDFLTSADLNEEKEEELYYWWRGGMAVADELLLESELPLFVLHYEYLQIVQQFSYVTMFSVIWALAPLMNLLRNVLEAQADAHKMFLYFRRPIPSRPQSSGSTTPIGNWEHMMWFQVHAACICTSAFFTFCTGEMEAWISLFHDEQPTAQLMKEGNWTGCHPNLRENIVQWTYGNCYQTEATNGTPAVPWDSEEVQKSFPPTLFPNVMAPNIECWEDRKVNYSIPMCDQPGDFAQVGSFGFTQGASRLLIFLLLNHVQLGIVAVARHCTKGGPKRVVEKIQQFDRKQKDLLAMAVFREDEATVRAWHRARHVISMRRRIRVKVPSAPLLPCCSPAAHRP